MSKSLNITSATTALMAATAALGVTLTNDVARDLVKANNIKSMKRVNEVAATAAKPKTRRIRSERVIEPGARGFRFAGKWNESVKSGSGIAVHPAYLLKLKAHAKAMGVSSAGSDEAAVKAMCTAIVDAGLVPATAE